MPDEPHDRILDAAVEFEVDLARLAQAVLVYDQALMGDSLAVERGIAAVLAADGSPRKAGE